MKAPNTKERKLSKSFIGERVMDTLHATMLVQVINVLETNPENKFYKYGIRILEQELMDFACWWFYIANLKNKSKAIEELNTAIADGGWEGWKFEIDEKTRTCSIVKA